MTARTFLIRGLIAGFIAGILTFFVAYAVGEPPIDTAIALEEASAAAEPAAEAEGEHSHSHSHGEDGETEVSRATQKTWGLLTGTVTIGLALGGIVALFSAGTLGRLGRLRPGQSTALVTLIGFVSFALVPFLKYPATPPAVGSSDTIGVRTALYFGFVLVSVVAAVAATYAALKVREHIGTYGGVIVGVVAYLVVVIVAGQLFAPVNEIGDFPGDLLWSFRVASLLTLATMWGVIGLVLTGLISRHYTNEIAKADRRELAASL